MLWVWSQPGTKQDTTVEPTDVAADCPSVVLDVDDVPDWCNVVAEDSGSESDESNESNE